MKAPARQQLRAGAPAFDTVPGAVREPSSAVAPPDSPAATRATSRTWRDPRLLVGVVIVAVCVLLGARLFAAADDTVAVWSVRAGIPAGAVVDAEDLERVDLRFGSLALATRYLSARDALPEGTVLTRDVEQGELLPRSALGTAGGEVVLVELPIAVPSEAVPATVAPGELVDVWVTPDAESGRAPRAVRVLEQVRVIATPHDRSALGPSSTRQVVVGVTAGDESLVATALAEISRGTVVLVRRG